MARGKQQKSRLKTRKEKKSEVNKQEAEAAAAAEAEAIAAASATGARPRTNANGTHCHHHHHLHHRHYHNEPAVSSGIAAASVAADVAAATALAAIHEDQQPERETVTVQYLGLDEVVQYRADELVETMFRHPTRAGGCLDIHLMELYGKTPQQFAEDVRFGCSTPFRSSTRNAASLPSAPNRTDADADADEARSLLINKRISFFFTILCLELHVREVKAMVEGVHLPEHHPESTVLHLKCQEANNMLHEKFCYEPMMELGRLMLRNRNVFRRVMWGLESYALNCMQKYDDEGRQDFHSLVRTGYAMMHELKQEKEEQFQAKIAASKHDFKRAKKNGDRESMEAAKQAQEKARTEMNRFLATWQERWTRMLSNEPSPPEPIEVAAAAAIAAGASVASVPIQEAAAAAVEAVASGNAAAVIVVEPRTKNEEQQPVQTAEIEELPSTSDNAKRGGGKKKKMTSRELAIKDALKRRQAEMEELAKAAMISKTDDNKTPDAAAPTMPKADDKTPADKNKKIPNKTALDAVAPTEAEIISKMDEGLDKDKKKIDDKKTPDAVAPSTAEAKDEADKDKNEKIDNKKAPDAVAAASKKTPNKTALDVVVPNTVAEVKDDKKIVNGTAAGAVPRSTTVKPVVDEEAAAAKDSSMKEDRAIDNNEVTIEVAPATAVEAMNENKRVGSRKSPNPRMSTAAAIARAAANLEKNAKIMPMTAVETAEASVAIGRVMRIAWKTAPLHIRDAIGKLAEDCDKYKKQLDDPRIDDSEASTKTEAVDKIDDKKVAASTPPKVADNAASDKDKKTPNKTALDAVAPQTPAKANNKAVQGKNKQTPNKTALDAPTPTKTGAVNKVAENKNKKIPNKMVLDVVTPTLAEAIAKAFEDKIKNQKIDDKKTTDAVASSTNEAVNKTPQGKNNNQKIDNRKTPNANTPSTNVAVNKTPQGKNKNQKFDNRKTPNANIPSTNVTVNKTPQGKNKNQKFDNKKTWDAVDRSTTEAKDTVAADKVQNNKIDDNKIVNAAAPVTPQSVNQQPMSKKDKKKARQMAAKMVEAEAAIRAATNKDGDKEQTIADRKPYDQAFLDNFTERTDGQITLEKAVWSMLSVTEKRLIERAEAADKLASVRRLLQASVSVLLNSIEDDARKAACAMILTAENTLAKAESSRGDARALEAAEEAVRAAIDASSVVWRNETQPNEVADEPVDRKALWKAYIMAASLKYPARKKKGRRDSC